MFHRKRTLRRVPYNALAHMQMVQDVVGRLSTNSFAMKGWALTVSIAAIGYALANASWPVALLSFVPAVVFWILDAYFLRHERMFRDLYRDIAKGNTDSFEMNYLRFARNRTPLRTFFSSTLAWFYGSLVVLTVGVVLVGGLFGILHADPQERHPCGSHCKQLS